MFFNKKIIYEIKLDSQINELLKTVRLFLVSYLTGKENDFKKLKLDIMQPLLTQQWNENAAKEAEKINKALGSKGEKIRKAWNQYKEDLLEAQRMKKDTKLIEAKLEVLDKLMEGVNV